MKNQKCRTMFQDSPLVLVILLLFWAASSNSQEVEDERAFDYVAESSKGPRAWGQINKEWSACSNGKLQSPIDFSDARVKIIGRGDQTNYEATSAVVKNRGHDIAVYWNGYAGGIVINGTEYALKQAHWHSPSEHTINGKRYDLELHMVHLNNDPTLKNNIAVTGVLFEIGQPDKFLTKLTVDIASMIRMKDEERKLAMLDPNAIQLDSRFYYRYEGSLTVPPCTEGVIWTINKKIATVSEDQVKLLRAAVHDYAERNSRPLQETNRRDVYLYGPLLQS